ncbi:MAG: energy coupling factor transporter S component ThiW [Candidatus Bathycorpusculaceae bacterium]
MKTSSVNVKKLAIVIVFSALGVALAPVSWFEFLGSKAYPTQHMINAILGVLVGPLWAAIAAIIIGSIRNVFGIGTFYAFPGGIPGGVVVGTVYWLLKRLKLGGKPRLISALTEPLGTVFIGVPVALFLVAPWLGSQKLLDLISTEGVMFAFLIFGSGWALSCVPGSIIGFMVLLILNRVGINRETLFGEK